MVTVLHDLSLTLIRSDTAILHISIDLLTFVFFFFPVKSCQSLIYSLHTLPVSILQDFNLLTQLTVFI